MGLHMNTCTLLGGPYNGKTVRIPADAGLILVGTDLYEPGRLAGQSWRYHAPPGQYGPALAIAAPGSDAWVSSPLVKPEPATGWITAVKPKHDHDERGWQPK